MSGRRRSALRMLASGGATALLALAGAGVAYALTTAGARPLSTPIGDTTTTTVDTTTGLCICTGVCLDPSCVTTDPPAATTTNTTTTTDTTTTTRTTNAVTTDTVTTATTTTAPAPPPPAPAQPMPTTTQALPPAATSTTMPSTTTTTTATVAAPAARTAPPRLSASAGIATPLWARRLPHGRVRVSASVSVDEPASLLVRVLDPVTGASIPLLAGTRLGVAAATAPATQLAGAAAAGGPVAIALVLPAAALQRGRVERVVVVANDSSGRRATIVIRFRDR